MIYPSSPRTRRMQISVPKTETRAGCGSSGSPGVASPLRCRAGPLSISVGRALYIPIHVSPQVWDRQRARRSPSFPHPHAATPPHAYDTCRARERICPVASRDRPPPTCLRMERARRASGAARPVRSPPGTPSPISISLPCKYCQRRRSAASPTNGAQSVPARPSRIVFCACGLRDSPPARARARDAGERSRHVGLATTGRSISK